MPAICFSMWNAINPKRLTNSDHNLGYVNALKVFGETTDYLESQKLNNDSIFAGFLMTGALTDTMAGFVHSGHEFRNISNTAKSRYFIFSSPEGMVAMKDSMRNSMTLELIKEFSSYNASIWIFKRKN